MSLAPRGGRVGAAARALLHLLERRPVPLPHPGDDPQHADTEQADPKTLQSFVDAVSDVSPQLFAAVALLGGDPSDRPGDGQQVRLDTECGVGRGWNKAFFQRAKGSRNLSESWLS